MEMVAPIGHVSNFNSRRKKTFEQIHVLTMDLLGLIAN